MSPQTEKDNGPSDREACRQVACRQPGRQVVCMHAGRWRAGSQALTA